MMEENQKGRIKRGLSGVARRYAECRRALSPVIAAVALASILCIIVFVASNLANDIVSEQVEEAQFEQAKYVMISLDRLIKRIMYEPESSGYVKTSFWKVTPYFETVGNLIVKVETSELEIPITSMPVNVIKIKGGPNVGVASEQNLLGNEKLIVKDAASPLGNIKVYQKNGAWISLDYARIRCINTGTGILYYNGTGYEPYNTIEITIIQIIFKDYRVEEQASFIARNTGITSGNSPIEVKGNFTITTILEKPGLSGPIRESVTLRELGGNPSYKTLINVAIIGIEISILGGV